MAEKVFYLDLNQKILTNSKGCENCQDYYEIFVIGGQDCYTQEIHKWRPENCINCFKVFLYNEMEEVWPIWNPNYQSNQNRISVTVLQDNVVGYLCNDLEVDMDKEIQIIYLKWCKKHRASVEEPIKDDLLAMGHSTVCITLLQWKKCPRCNPKKKTNKSKAEKSIRKTHPIPG